VQCFCYFQTTSLDVLRCTENDLFFLCTLSYVVWYFFGGNSHHSINIFKIQKTIIRFITNIGRRNPCCQLFEQLQTLTPPSQYTFSMLLFINKNREMFLSNSEICDINTQYNYNLHLPSTNLALVQKEILYSGRKVYNCLPSNINTFRPNGVYILRGLSSHQSGAL
jgi:hypothetical protein